MHLVYMRVVSAETKRVTWQKAENIFCHLLLQNHGKSTKKSHNYTVLWEKYKKVTQLLHILFYFLIYTIKTKINCGGPYTQSWRKDINWKSNYK